MTAGRGLLAAAVCLVLIMQSLTFTAALGVTTKNNFEGDWTGKIDKIQDWKNDAGSTEYYRIGADITFTADEYGHITGEGTAWVEYTVNVHDNSVGDCYYEGRQDNLTFDVSGDYDKDTGKADLLISNPPGFSDKEGTYSPGRLYSSNFCPGEYGYFITPFANSYAYPSYDLGSFDLVDGATVDGQLGYGDTGYNRLVIYGPTGQKNECPGLAITPTMPPAYDPRNLAGPTDTASYRFEVAWEGTTPVRVNFDVQGGSDSINPSFAFNPANMQTSPINVIMDVATSDAEEGEYPLTIDAWVIDPDTGEECYAEQAATVTLVVSNESRASALEIVKQAGDVTILPKETEAGQPYVEVETGHSGAATVIVAGIETDDNTVSVTTIDVGSDTKIKEYEDVDHFAKIFEDNSRNETPAWLNYYQKFKEPSTLERIKEIALENSARRANFWSCLFGPDTASAEVCTGQSVVYVSEGELHLDHKTATGAAADRLQAELEKEYAELKWDKLLKALATPTTLIIPTGTEITTSVKQSVGWSVTSVTVLDGSALVVDLVSEEIKLVNAGEKYTLETSFAGQRVSTIDDLESVSMDSVPQWWKVQIGDFGTAKAVRGIEEGNNVEPVDITSVFSDHDATVEAWVEWLGPPSYDIYFKWYAPDGSLYETWDTNYSRAVLGYRDGQTYGSFGNMDISGFEPAEKPGLWKLKVYYEGDLVKEIPFYITKSTLIKDQSASYELVVNVVSDNKDFSTDFENSIASGATEAFAGANISDIDDIEWLKTTILDNSATVRVQDTLKVKGKSSIDAEPRSLTDASQSVFIPTIGMDSYFTIQTGYSDPFPSELAWQGIVNLDVGDSNIKAFRFSENKKFVEGENSADITITSHYEKETGILVDNLISGSMVLPEIGEVKLNYGIRAIELSIPTTLTISSVSSEIQQNQDATISGTISPPLNGQVLLIYQKSDGSDEPIKRTVPVSNGAFSDTYKMDNDGTYSVSAEYLGSGAYLSSISDATTLTVAPSGCLIATSAFGSELTPQVQFLRNFRDNHILSTTAGSSFMNVFNSWYYSFSPAVANYEREQPWLQTTVKAAIYPLLGILHVSENAYSLIPGEFGALSAGMIASGMIGAIYLSPVALSIKQVRKSRFNYRVAILIIGAAFIAVVSAILASNETALMITTSFFVLSVISITAILSGKALMIIYQNLTDVLREL